MTIELTYNQLKAPKPTLLDKLADIYWSHQHRCDAALFIGVVALVVAVVVAAA